MKNWIRFNKFASSVIVGLVLSVAAEANPHQLDTISYNFRLAGGGGGLSGVLDQSVNLETFCIDFANEIDFPQSYTANLTSITSGSNLSLTRFGAVTNWTNLTITGDAADTAILNGIVDALGRYQMAAYLISTYDLSASPASNAYNNGIQEAVWEIMDPFASPNSPHLVDPANALTAAVQWFTNTSVSARDTYLASFRVVTDATACSGALTGCGFQEQMTQLPGVPEPRLGAMVLLGSMLAFGFLRRRSKTV